MTAREAGTIMDRMDALRASDADRERVVASLARHANDGRLTAEELEERAGQAYAVRTLGEVDALEHDLPREAATR